MSDMRTWINVASLREAAETPPPNIDDLMRTFNDWLVGDAMNNVNDDGERYPLTPYLNCIATLSRIVPPKRLRGLTGTLYRGIQTDADLTLLPVPGLVKTANKRFQSWTPKRAVARTFATDYTGAIGYIFHAEVDSNRQRLALSVADVCDWYNRRPETDDDILYRLEAYAHQDEILLRGTTVAVAKVETIKRRGRAS